MSEQFYFWRTVGFSSIAVPLVIAATRVCSPDRVEGELNLIFSRPRRGVARREITFHAAPPELNGYPLSESDLLVELEQQVEWNVQNAVSAEELTAFRKTSQPLRIDESRDSPVVTQLLGQYL